jgi:hypothetical protein
LGSPLINPLRKNNGIVQITGEETKKSGEINTMKLKGEITKDSGPIFFIVWKQLSPNQYKPVYKSEIKSAERGSQNWNAFKLDKQTLCGGDES